MQRTGAQKTSPKYFNDYKSEFDKICYNSSLSQQTFSYEWPILTGLVLSSCRSVCMFTGDRVFWKKRLTGSTCMQMPFVMLGSVGTKNDVLQAVQTPDPPW